MSNPAIITSLFIFYSLSSLSQAQDSLEIITAGMIHYEVSTIPVADSGLIRFKDIVHIYAPPFYLQVLGTFANNSGYYLYKKDNLRAFYCLPKGRGVTFLPATTRKKGRTYLSDGGETDTILGLLVYKKIHAYEKDTLISWETDSITFPGTEFPIASLGLSLTWKVGETVFHTRASRIQLLHLHPKYFTPEMSHAPVTFETNLEAFLNMAFKLSPSSNDHNQRLSGFIPVRRPLFMVRDYPELQVGSPMPLINGKFFKRGEKFRMRDRRGYINVFILMDYSILQPVPPFLSMWLTQLQSTFPEIKIMILTPSDARFILDGLYQNPVLANIPHLVTRKEIYKRFEWQDPLSYVVTDRHLNIVFMESAFDVNEFTELEEAIKTVHHNE